MSRKLASAMVCALAMGALAPVAEAHTLSNERVAAQARAMIGQVHAHTSAHARFENCDNHAPAERAER
jgi:carbon monoxide dehydrogenase subunit G